MLIAIVPIIVLVLGLLAYLIPGSPERKEIGRIAFFVGLLFTVATLSHTTWRFG